MPGLRARRQGSGRPSDGLAIRGVRLGPVHGHDGLHAITSSPVSSWPSPLRRRSPRRGRLPQRAGALVARRALLPGPRATSSATACQQPDALREAFQGLLGAAPASGSIPSARAASSGSRYNARFYERRVAVPSSPRLLVPVSGDRAILRRPLAGYVAAMLAIFWLLLLLRFRLVVAAAVTLAHRSSSPALTDHSSFPLTDSWGLALEFAAFGTAISALQRGPRWVIAWAAAIAAALDHARQHVDPRARRGGLARWSRSARGSTTALAAHGIRRGAAGRDR